MDSLWTGIAGGAGTAGLIGFGKWLLGKVRQDGAEEVEEKRIEERDTGIRQDLADIRADLKSWASEWRAIGSSVERLTVNVAMAAKSLDAVAAKQEQHSDKIADLSSTTRLLTDNVTMMGQRIAALEKEARGL